MPEMGALYIFPPPERVQTVSYTHLQLLGVGNARWFGSGRYTAFAMFAIFVVTPGAGYLVWRSDRDAQSFDALLRQLGIAAKGDPAPVCVPEDSSLYAASKAVSDIGAHLQELSLIHI